MMAVALHGCGDSVSASSLPGQYECSGVLGDEVSTSQWTIYAGGAIVRKVDARMPLEESVSVSFQYTASGEWEIVRGRYLEIVTLDVDGHAATLNGPESQVVADEELEGLFALIVSDRPEPILLEMNGARRDTLELHLGRDKMTCRRSTAS